MNVTLATPKQLAFILRLTDERDWNSLDGLMYERAFDVNTHSEKQLFSREASLLIEALLALPHKATAATAPAAPGYYVQDGTVFVVVENKAKTSTYAKRLDLYTADDGASRARWEYAPGVGRTLATLVPLTVEEAARLGHLHGVCVICAKPLTDPKSVARGIGPVCVTRIGA